MHNYYEILNISADASKETIKSSYRKEALKWHPDRNKSPEATERMQLINEAYLILKDDEARARYDREYKRYFDFKEQQQHPKEETSATEKQKYRNTEEEYTFNDEILNDWIQKARRQAKDLAKQSLDDLVGMSKAATSSAWEATKYHILLLVVLIFVFKLIGVY